MQAAAKRRNMHLTSLSRPLTPEDFSAFDYIIGILNELETSSILPD